MLNFAKLERIIKAALPALMLVVWTEAAPCSSYDDLNAGIQFSGQEDWRAAVYEFDKALAAKDLIPGLQFVAFFDRGQAYENLGQYDLAITDYSRSLTLRSREPQSLWERARAYLIAAKFQQAESDLDTLISVRPMFTSAYKTRAEVSARLGQTEKSAADLKFVLSEQPDQYEQRNLRSGIVAWEAGQMALAEGHFVYTIPNYGELNYGDVYAWLWLALTELRRGKEVPRDALPHFDKKAWPTPVVSVFLDEMDVDAALGAATQGDTSTANGRICEANFYLGEWLLLHKNTVLGTKLINKAANECPLNYREWGPAQIELGRLSR